MELDYSGLDADDLAMGASLYVAAFAAAPWHERWAIGDAFDRLVDCFPSPKQRQGRANPLMRARHPLGSGTSAES